MLSRSSRAAFKPKTFTWRFYFLSVILLVVLVCLVARIITLGVIKRPFLLKESTARSVHVIDIPAHRGRILDRNGAELAASFPVDSVWVNPRIFAPSESQLTQLSSLLDLPLGDLQAHLSKAHGRAFLYLKRHVNADTVTAVQRLSLHGLFLQQEYQRYYPEDAAASQLLGFTNIDDEGQENLELAYNNWLRGVTGKVQVVQDRLGDIVGYLDVVRPVQPGHDLSLSIDRRIQYLAYHELKKAVTEHQAESGALVVLSAKTGEILALVSFPSCDPNKRQNIKAGYCRNRAVTDLFEPGSTIKTFSIAAALESGKYSPKTLVDTNPGYLHIDKNLVHDDDNRNNGLLTVTGILQKSSNIGVAKVVLTLPPGNLVNMMHRVGFGQTTNSGFPGEASGVLPPSIHLGRFGLATLAFGYGISTTALQLAQAYAIIANDGVLRPLSILKLDKPLVGKQIMTPVITRQILLMLKKVVELGTGEQASVEGYTVAGKTGTARIVGPHGYDKNKHWALFAGVAPASRPELVVVVEIKNPHGRLYHGGSVAAPVFANVIHGSLRMLGVPEDNKL